jgi:hypothetical protein
MRDDSQLRHATKHFKSSGYPVIEGYDPLEGWGWCFVDNVMVDLGADTTSQDGPSHSTTDWREGAERRHSPKTTPLGGAARAARGYEKG